MPLANLIMKKFEKQRSVLDFVREMYILPTATLKKDSWESFAVSDIPCCIPELLMYETVVAHMGHRNYYFILLFSLSPHTVEFKGSRSYRRV